MPYSKRKSAYFLQNLLKKYFIIEFFIFHNRIFYIPKSSLLSKNSGHPDLYSITEFYTVLYNMSNVNKFYIPNCMIGLINCNFIVTFVKFRGFKM